MEFDKTESAKWSLAVNEAMDQYEQAKEAALADNAARGFPAPSGASLADLLTAGTEVKRKLAGANGKLYEEKRERIFKVAEFAMVLAVQVAKLVMQAYKETILNQVAIEQAEADAKEQRGRADVERLNAATEVRQAAIIQAKAAAEQEINQYRQQLVDAETVTLDAEKILINAQVETAEARLAIIDSIYQVIAAEDLVLAAENRRVAALEIVMEAHTRIAAIKKETVPYHEAKAVAREKLAEAVTQDAATREELEKLGYDRLRLKEAQEDQEHQIRDAELDYELAKEAHARATMAEELARVQSRRLLQEYANQVRDEILAKKKALEEAGVVFKLETALARKQIDVDGDISLSNYDVGLAAVELAAQLAYIQSVAVSKAATVSASGAQVYRTDTTTLFSRRIRRGSI
ncbi:MAG: hypothetical protein QME78_00120 [Thermodesulfobacteriota bacterium]|nr:hypothetical protein [Thermodesulfobacteriota bacterium]